MIIKGYATSEGYRGYINGRYILFDTEDEYLATVREIEDNGIFSD